MIVARILEPASKLATARGFHPETATSSLAAVLGLEETIDETQLYRRKSRACRSTGCFNASRVSKMLSPNGTSQKVR